MASLDWAPRCASQTSQHTLFSTPCPSPRQIWAPATQHSLSQDHIQILSRSFSQRSWASSCVSGCLRPHTWVPSTCWGQESGSHASVLWSAAAVPLFPNALASLRLSLPSCKMGLVVAPSEMLRRSYKMNPIKWHLAWSLACSKLDKSYLLLIVHTEEKPRLPEGPEWVSVQVS